jgi:diguanylate cyclase (GGDEF)-like protein
LKFPAAAADDGMVAPPGRKLDALRQEALAAARGLSNGESALAGVLRDLEQERSRAAQAYHAVVRSLAAALEARDGYTGEHSDDVHDLSVAVAQRLGLDTRATAEVEAVALLHDIGKIGIPDQVLHKPGPLTGEEWSLMREHPVIGERILRPLPGLSTVATAVRHEHERWDGGGYPDGVAGDEIPLASRIVLACDAYHALVSDRPYRRAMRPEHARTELRANAGTQFDPAVVDALLACLEDPQPVGKPPSAERVARVLTEPEQEGAAGRLERELHALIAIASAVGAAQRVEDVVEVAADEACEAVAAASLSISAWEVDRRILRTLVNAGELGPGEVRLPADETYRLQGDTVLRGVLESGGTYFATLDRPDCDPLEAELLERLGKRHAIGLGIRFAGRAWGELWATRRAGQPPFDERDARFLQTVAGQIAAAVGRAEMFSRMAELAFQDPLTGVANRRALDERLELSVADAVRSGDDLAVLLCDLDNLKELNDVHGHQAGDDALARVAGILRDAAGDPENTLVARIGGDEFCVLLEGADADAARRLGDRLIMRLLIGSGPALSVSCGVASVGLGATRPGELLRAADAAQYTAKRSGRARVCVADGDAEASWRASSGERRAIRGRADGAVLDVAELLARAVEALDGAFEARPVFDRVEAAAHVAAEAVDATAMAISWLGDGRDLIETWFAGDRRVHRSTGKRFGADGESFPAADYPATAALLARGGSFVLHAGDEDADEAERALLAQYGMDAVLAVAVRDADGGAWLVEIYADGLTRPLEAAEPAVRLVVGEAVHGARPVAPRLRGAQAA